MYLTFIYNDQSIFALVREIAVRPKKNKNWVEWAERLTIGEFVVWLAGHIADHLFAKRIMTMDQMIDSVDNDPSGMQKDAEQFLQRLYLPYSPFPQKRHRMTTLFRHLVQRQIRRRG